MAQTSKGIMLREPLDDPSKSDFLAAIEGAFDDASAEEKKSLVSFFQIKGAVKHHLVWRDLFSYLPENHVGAIAIQDFYRKSISSLVGLAKEAIKSSSPSILSVQTTPITINDLLHPLIGSKLDDALEKAIDALQPIHTVQMLKPETDKALLVYSLLCMIGGSHSSIFYNARHRLNGDHSITFLTIAVAKELAAPITSFELNVFGRAKTRIRGARDLIRQKSILNTVGIIRAQDFAKWPLTTGQSGKANAWLNRYGVDVYKTLMSCRGLPTHVDRIHRPTAILAQLIIDYWFEYVLEEPRELRCTDKEDGSEDCLYRMLRDNKKRYFSTP
jgi:hypothetical protein